MVQSEPLFVADEQQIPSRRKRQESRVPQRHRLRLQRLLLPSPVEPRPPDLRPLVYLLNQCFAVDLEGQKLVDQWSSVTLWSRCLFLLISNPLICLPKVPLRWKGHVLLWCRLLQAPLQRFNRSATLSTKHGRGRIDKFSEQKNRKCVLDSYSASV